MPRYFRKLAVLAKIETVYGTDAVPTGAVNAMQMTSVQLEPLKGEDVSRDLITPNMGHQGVILTGNYASLTGEVELAGAGAAGTVPSYGTLLRMCGMSEVIAAGVDVQYQPVSANHEAGTLYFNMDGVNHVLLGVRGTFTIDLKPKEIPRLKFTFTGLLGTIADVALPVTTLTGFRVPVPVSRANTIFSLHGYAGACEGVSLDLGASIEPRLLINHESIQYTDRAVTGSAIMEAAALATINWFGIATAHTKGVMVLTHGTLAGNIVRFDAPAVQVGRPTLGENQKIVNNTLPLMLLPNVGNDELKITVR